MNLYELDGNSFTFKSYILYQFSDFAEINSTTFLGAYSTHFKIFQVDFASQILTLLP
jgi:hypothetical protein